MKTLLLLSLVAFLGAQQPAPDAVPTGRYEAIAFEFQPRADAHRPFYILSVYTTVTPANSTGAGQYVEYPVDIPEGPPNQPVFLTVSAATMQRMLAAHDGVAHSAAIGGCATRRKGIASTGKKTLIFGDGDQKFSCEFDYSDDARVQDSSDAFQAMAETLQFSDRLDHAHRFDRLGLDAEMDALVSENSAGRAIELQNIARTLQSIVDDDRVIERVRRKAVRLLQDAAGTPVPKAANSR
jgi:hypothetical protein